MPFEGRDDGIIVHVRLTPKASVDAVVGVGQASNDHKHVLVKVRAVPDKGAANAALVMVLADFLRVAKSDVSILSGKTSRLKTVKIAGNGATLAQRFQAALAD